jgi:hypothetical protein
MESGYAASETVGGLTMREAAATSRIFKSSTRNKCSRSLA